MMDHPGPSAQIILTHRLANGLQVVGQPMPEAESVAVAYYVRTGARDEHDPAQEGISHFLEHILFKGTATLDRHQLDQAFTRIGAKRNGFTSTEYTFYYAQVLSDYLPGALDLLSEMMYPRFVEEEFEAEKEVILNEISRAEDHPQSFTYRQMMRAYFGEQPLGNNVLGSRESIQRMQLDQMKVYWHKRYVAQNAMIAIAGKFAWEPFLALAERYGKRWQQGQGGRSAFAYEPAHPHSHVLVSPQRKQQVIRLAMPMVARESQDYEAARLGASVLGRPKGSRLYWQIVHQGLAVSAWASCWAMEGTGLLSLQANVLPQKARQVLDLLRAELEHLLEDGLTEEELQRAKALWIRDLFLDAELSYPQMLALAFDWRPEKPPLSMNEQIARIQHVTVDDVMRVFHRFPLREKQVMVAYGPLNEQQLCS
jgi:predicted Zn-dependent peptidase